MLAEEALKLGLCKYCTLYQKIGKTKECKCVAGRFPSLNYKNVKIGECTFSKIQIMERIRQYGRA